MGRLNPKLGPFGVVITLAVLWTPWAIFCFLDFLGVRSMLSKRAGGSGASTVNVVGAWIAAFTVLAATIASWGLYKLYRGRFRCTLSVATGVVVFVLLALIADVLMKWGLPALN